MVRLAATPRTAALAALALALAAAAAAAVAVATTVEPDAFANAATHQRALLDRDMGEGLTRQQFIEFCESPDHNILQYFKLFADADGADLGSDLEAEGDSTARSHSRSRSCSRPVLAPRAHRRIPTRTQARQWASTSAVLRPTLTEYF